MGLPLNTGAVCVCLLGRCERRDEVIVRDPARSNCGGYAACWNNASDSPTRGALWSNLCIDAAYSVMPEAAWRSSSLLWRLDHSDPATGDRLSSVGKADLELLCLLKLSSCCCHSSCWWRCPCCCRLEGLRVRHRHRRGLGDLRLRVTEDAGWFVFLGAG